uniref:Uncharacterized protein n=1 Tax=Rangifer tarandus platyrhynchus TaxID=3082113 RepID=A0ACB0EKM6_RANTA|nr:unnamed protein product [Rangifer tarandus platyrhynchus]
MFEERARRTARRPERCQGPSIRRQRPASEAPRLGPAPLTARGVASTAEVRAQVLRAPRPPGATAAARAHPRAVFPPNLGTARLGTKGEGAPGAAADSRSRRPLRARREALGGPALRPPLTGRRGPPEPPPPPGLGPSRRPPPHVPRVAIAFAATVVSPPPPLSPPPSPQSPAEAEAAPAAASRSRRPEPRGGACALRAAMGAGASRRGLGAGGREASGAGMGGGGQSARAAARVFNFPRRVCALPSGPGRGTCRSDPPSRNLDPGWAQTSPPGQVIPPACFSGRLPAGRASLRAGI